MEALISLIGNDILIVIGGGQNFHVGSVAVAYPYNRGGKGQNISSSVSLITVRGHREDQLVLEASRRLSINMDKCVVLCAGLHIDDAKTGDIQKMVDNFNCLISDVEQFLTNHCIA